jgi:hypothetical protein
MNEAHFSFGKEKEGQQKLQEKNKCSIDSHGTSIWQIWGNNKKGCSCL